MSLSLFAPKTVICWCLVVASPAVVFGGLNPQGGEYPVAGSLLGDQTLPHAVLRPDGGVVVWQDNAVNPRGLRIRAQILDESFGAAGAPVVVSSAFKSKTAGDQEKPQVASLPDGGAVIVWQGGKPGSQQIFARFMTASSVFPKSDIRVSSHSKNNQSNPQVVALIDGTVVVVWSSEGQDGSMQGIYAQLFSATGSKIGKEFQVNLTTLNNQRTPAVAALADGNFVVVWISELQRGLASVDVYGRIFNPSSVPLGAEFLISSTTNKLCANPSVAASSDSFAVVWSQNAASLIPTPTLLPQQNSDGLLLPPSAVGPVRRSTDSWDIFGRLLTTGGMPLTDAFRINLYTYGDQFAPRVSGGGNNNYMAVWTALNETNSLGQLDQWDGVFGQLFDNTGSLLANDVNVNTTRTSRQHSPVVVSDGANAFLVVWSSIVVNSSLVSYATFDVFAQSYLRTEGQ